jgi:3-hydroxyisobutyrate dehydrogenase-like beta-hydroxyacid dehydrogenase
MTSKPNIAWIGAGRMGVPMAGFILKAGYAVAVYSRTAASRQKLAALGARAAVSVADCVAGADLIFSSISDDAALRAIALGADGLLAHAKRDCVFAETSTVSNQVSAEVDRAAAHSGVAYLRMPISGNAASAQNAEVTVLVSGPLAAWQRVKPVVETFSKAQLYLGGEDQARTMKLVVNLMVINMAQSMAEALALGSKAGLDWNVMLDTLTQSTIASPFLRAKANLLKAHDFTPTMTARLILKDIDLMLAAASASSVPLPLTDVTRALVQTLVNEGQAEDDYMALVKLARQRSGLPGLA